MEAARAGKCASYVHLNKEIFKLQEFLNFLTFSAKIFSKLCFSNPTSGVVRASVQHAILINHCVISKLYYILPQPDTQAAR